MPEAGERVYIPLHGVYMTTVEIPLGTATLTQFFYEEVEDMSERYLQEAEQCLSQKNIFRHIFLERLRSVLGRFHESACFMFTVPKFNEIVAEKLLTEARQLVEVLRYANAFLRPRDVTDSMLIAIEPPTTAEGSVLPERPQRFPVWKKQLNVLGKTPFALHDDKVSYFSTIGIDRLAELVTSTRTLSKYEQMIQRAVHWVAIAEGQDDKETRFINLITAMEVIFSDRSENVRTVLGEGPALLLADTTDQRVFVRNKLRNYYDKRSDIVHGRTTTITKDDFFYLTTYVTRIIAYLVAYLEHEQFKTPDDFRTWLTNHRLAAAPLPHYVDPFTTSRDGRIVPLTEAKNAR